MTKTLDYTVTEVLHVGNVSDGIFEEIRHRKLSKLHQLPHNTSNEYEMRK